MGARTPIEKPRKTRQYQAYNTRKLRAYGKRKVHKWIRAAYKRYIQTAETSEPEMCQGCGWYEDECECKKWEEYMNCCAYERESDYLWDVMEYEERRRVQEMEAWAHYELYPEDLVQIDYDYFDECGLYEEDD